MPFLMKGHKWTDHKHKVQYPVYVEEKVDEVRCHARLVGDHVEFLTYSGNKMANMQPFEQAMRDYMVFLEVADLDLGFEVNSDFDSSRRWIRSTRGLPADLVGKPTRFLLFDVPCKHSLFVFRIDMLDVMAEHAKEFGLRVDRPRRIVAHNEAEVMQAYTLYREQGGEGAMVKTTDHQYVPGTRSYGWLKVKPSEDADGVIIELHEAVCGKDQPELRLKIGDKLGRAGSVTLRLADGSECTPHGIEWKLGTDMLQHPEKYLGEIAEFNYMERDTAGGYRHPTWHRLREK